MWIINIHLSWVNRDTKMSNSMECELGSVRDSEPCQTMTWLSMLIMFRMPFCTRATVVIGLSAVPSDHVKSKLYIKGPIGKKKREICKGASPVTLQTVLIKCT